MAITDPTTGAFHQLTESAQINTTAQGFEMRSSHASAVGGDGRDEIRIVLNGLDVTLQLRQTKAPVLAFGDGHSSAYCQDFDMYSRARMKVTGDLVAMGDQQSVAGTASFDHLWGFYPGAAVAETTALKYSLRDGRDILLGLARPPRSNAITLSFGWISDKQGRVRRLHRGDYSLTPGRTWSAGPGCSYPIDWDVTVLGLRLHSRPVLDESELRVEDPAVAAAWPEWPRYWDGPTEISGDAEGHGWMDLTHYCAG
jgi:predicted secreted hydrolase